jgi:Lrp/AsnC family transcriptional regulator, regulator for asnA, asnC and gidA
MIPMQTEKTNQKQNSFKKMDPKDLLFIAHLRKNARETLTNISKHTSIPISTLYDRLRVHESSIIKKHTTLLDFEKLGYSCKAKIILGVDRQERQKIEEYLMKHMNVNSLFKINNGYDYLIEGIFSNIKDVDDFVNSLQDKFKILEQKTFFVLNDIKREGFMADPDLVEMQNK